MNQPRLYFDLGSPYAYLACERAEAVLGVEPVLQPVLLGAIFAARGFGSWSATPAREMRIAELQARATRYGLPELRWPAGWPGDGLGAMRAAIFAQRAGAPTLAAFASSVFCAQFGDGRDIADPEVLADGARDAGLDPEELLRAIAHPEIKRELRRATEAAWQAGVRGVPTVVVGESLFFGDDQLELAGLALAG